jgi:hypothetical protein
MLLGELLPGKNLPCRTAGTPINVATPPREMAARVRMAVEREYAVRLHDVLYVSTYWGHERPLDRDWLVPVAREMAALLNWDEAGVESEVSGCLAESAP